MAHGFERKRSNWHCRDRFRKDFGVFVACFGSCQCTASFGSVPIFSSLFGRVATFSFPLIWYKHLFLVYSIILQHQVKVPLYLYWHLLENWLFRFKKKLRNLEDLPVLGVHVFMVAPPKDLRFAIFKEVLATIA